MKGLEGREKGKATADAPNGYDDQMWNGSCLQVPAGGILNGRKMYMRQ